MLWVHVQDRKAFIFDFVIDERFRGKGLGKQALTAMDEKLKSMNVLSVELHVFADNVSAQQLYREMGFVVTDMRVIKYVAQP